MPRNTVAGRWTPERKAMVGLSGAVLVEVLDRYVGLRGRATDALATWMRRMDSSTRRDLYRAEANLIIRAVTGSRRRVP